MQDAPVRPGRSYVVAVLGIPNRRQVGTFGQNLWFGTSKLVGSWGHERILGGGNVLGVGALFTVQPVSRVHVPVPYEMRLWGLWEWFACSLRCGCIAFGTFGARLQPLDGRVSLNPQFSSARL